MLFALASPAARADMTSSSVELDANRLVITIDSAGHVFVGAREMNGDAAIVAALRASGATEVMIMCDRSRPHAELVHVIELCKRAGITKISLDVAP